MIDDSAARFRTAVSVILDHEGGLIDDKADTGEITDFGISLRFLRSIGLDVDGDGDVDDDDILAMTKDTAIQIYKKYWWDKYHYEAIEDMTLVIKIFDIAVNMGGREAHKIVQRSINSLLLLHHIDEDGIIGPATIRAINELTIINKNAQLLYQIRYNSLQFYKGLVKHNPKLKKYLKGWIRRASF